jgi:hypothetical protein
LDDETDISVVVSAVANDFRKLQFSNRNLTFDSTKSRAA